MIDIDEQSLRDIQLIELRRYGLGMFRDGAIAGSIVATAVLLFLFWLFS